MHLLQALMQHLQHLRAAVDHRGPPRQCAAELVLWYIEALYHSSSKHMLTILKMTEGPCASRHVLLPLKMTESPCASRHVLLPLIVAIDHTAPPVLSTHSRKHHHVLSRHPLIPNTFKTVLRSIQQGTLSVPIEAACTSSSF